MRAVLEAVAERMVGADHPSPAELNVAGNILQYVQALPPPVQQDLKRLLFLFEYLPLFVIFRPRRFSRLPPADQDRYLEAWGTSRFGVLRTGFRVLKSLCISRYYQNPASWKAIGFER